MLDPRQLAPETVRPLLRREYERLVDLGMFKDERVELLRGQLVTMSPQGAPHSTVTARLAQALIRQLDKSYDVRSHSPFAASVDSEPEPDVSVARRQRKEAYHPSRVLLLIEVAESSLRKDRKIKSEIYAENGAPEYWIFDVKTKTVFVFTKPQKGRYTMAQEFRAGYLRPTRLGKVRISITRMFRG